MAQDGPAWAQHRPNWGEDRLKMGPALGILATRARARAMGFEEVIGAGGCEPRSGCECIIYSIYRYMHMCSRVCVQHLQV